MKKLIALAIIGLSTNSFALDHNFGELPDSIKQKYQEEQIRSLISQSKKMRYEDENIRSIASFTAEDEYWANEYDKLMKDRSKKDYLSMSLKY